MDVLQLLEQKISSLVALVSDLKEQNKKLSEESLYYRVEYEELLKDRNALATKLDDVEKKALEGDGQINELNQEKALTKMAVDDLLERLKVIDSLVEK